MIQLRRQVRPSLCPQIIHSASGGDYILTRTRFRGPQKGHQRGLNILMDHADGKYVISSV